jgi:IclR family KDG regulon transcriptional repressor
MVRGPVGRESTPLARGRGRNGRKEVASVQRALDLLEAMAHLPADTSEIGISDLSKQTRLSKSTVARLVSNLESRGYVGQNPATEKYHLGWKILEISQAKLRSIGLREVARPFLERLARETGETVNLAVLDRGEIVMVDVIETTDRVRVSVPVGSREPVHCTSLGKAMLAYLPTEAVEQFLTETGMPAHTERTITSPALLLSELMLTRRRGYAVDDREVHSESRCVGAPIFDYTGRPIAAISVAGLAERMTYERQATNGARARAAADAVSIRLGYSPPPEQ